MFHGKGAFLIFRIKSWSIQIFICVSRSLVRAESASGRFPDDRLAYQTSVRTWKMGKNMRSWQ